MPLPSASFLCRFSTVLRAIDCDGRRLRHLQVAWILAQRFQVRERGDLECGSASLKTDRQRRQRLVAFPQKLQDSHLKKLRVHVSGAQ